MLATVPEDTARKVADDVRIFGHGYIRIDRDGRAEHVPAHAFVDAAPCTINCSPCLGLHHGCTRDERRVHE